jgi:hypothetical protein
MIRNLIIEFMILNNKWAHAISYKYYQGGPKGFMEIVLLFKNVFGKW